MKIGVLAMQGAYREHISMLKDLYVSALEIRNKEELKGIDGLIIPGGESTTMGKLIRTLDLYNDLKGMIEEGLPVWGTCAGMILLSKNIYNENTKHLETMNIEVIRNAYGRQLGSFNTKCYMKGIGEDIEMVFIRAPYIKNIGEGVDALSIVDGKIVAARQNNMLVTSFHPELTDDNRVHKYFLDMVKSNINNS